MKNAIIALSAVLALSACASGSGGSGGVPSMYQPGGAWDAPAEPQADGAAAVTGARDAGSPQGASGLAPQEEPHDKPEFWLDDTNPTAGPAPRNSISGGVLDIGVVPPAPEGTTAVAAPTHGIEPTESGRLYILELYQEVLEQRDALALEVGGLVAELERAQAEIARLQGTASSERSTVAALEQEVALLRAENADLAARLTTAQVRRLEAEKLLLETKIAMQRAALDQAAPITSGIALKEDRP